MRNSGTLSARISTSTGQDSPIAIEERRTRKQLVVESGFHYSYFGWGNCADGGMVTIHSPMAFPFPGGPPSPRKVYVIAVIVSAIAAISIAPFSTTGTIASIGFGSLGVIWLASTILAWRCIHQRNWQQHERLMTYSYAACFAAVTLRFWLPTLIGVFQLKFSTAYPIVAWLSWVPNLVIAFWINSQRQEKPN
jgi:hypothetical protein